ncbi:hypothetical protein D3C71_1546800 [compost metagenome]|uniref:hypothetical protein n=1 Tax=Variovorax boronicumulans TaxID=436515 RepID=UPI000FB73FFE|nr:hypothetical protein [Variovorax boronicumulans]
MKPFLPRFLVECVFAQHGNATDEPAQAGLAHPKRTDNNRSEEIWSRAPASGRTHLPKRRFVAAKQHSHQTMGAAGRRGRPGRHLHLDASAGFSPSLHATVDFATHSTPRENK